MRTAAFPTLCILVVLTAGCRKTPPGSPGGEVPGPALDPEQEKFQGVWGVETWEALTTPERNEVEKQKEKLARFVFHKDRLAVCVPPEPRDAPVEAIPAEIVASFTLHPDAQPKLLKAREFERVNETTVEPSGNDRAEWIYKFEGEVLVIATTEFTPIDAHRMRATDFKPTPAARLEPGVSVVRLKKTKEDVPRWLKELTVLPPAKPEPGPEEVVAPRPAEHAAPK